MSRLEPTYSLLKYIEEEDKERFIAGYNICRPVIEALEKAISERIDKSISESDSKIDFESPNWSHRNAHRAGYREALRDVIKLLYKKTDDHL